MTVEAFATPYLTAAKVDELCAPPTRRHAQMPTCMLLGVDAFPRQPDGMPLVGRKLMEERLNASGDYKDPSGFNCSK